MENVAVAQKSPAPLMVLLWVVAAAILISLLLLGMPVQVVLIFALAVVTYIFPALMAFRRGHPGRNGVLILNILIGWTVIGWIVALIWAFSQGAMTSAAKA